MNAATNPKGNDWKGMKAVGTALALGGAALFALALFRLSPLGPGLTITLAVGLIFFGSLMIFAEKLIFRPPGIDNDNIFFGQITNRGIIAVLLGIFVTGMYIVIYFGHEIDLPAPYGKLSVFFTIHVYSLLNPISMAIKGKAADNWFFYSFAYTVAVLIFGARMLIKYRHNRYQMIRTLSVTFFQLGFGFILPSILVLFQKPEFYFHYFWPLKPEYFQPKLWLATLQNPEFYTNPAVYFIGFSAFTAFGLTPLLTYFFGKRWYCSWVCGCGGLAETAGDSFRQLSDNSLNSWKFERWLVHGILVCVTVVTVTLWLNSWLGGAILGKFSGIIAKYYGLLIGSVFSGVIGVGFYPLLGNRVWCRFGCPQAAILGIFQKFFSRFRITANGEQCIGCGNCSTYCEMGIDVRWYAQRGQNIVRASCVGCGVCAAVCPRGVLKLENGKPEGRTDDYFLKDLVSGSAKVADFN